MTPSNRSSASPGPDDPEEVDPTGIRDLLRSMPDPGPMPEDLVRRIETRLAVELAHRDGAPLRDAGAAPHGDRVVDLTAERSRRRPVRSLAMVGAAAAGLLLTTVVVGDVLRSGGLGGADTAAYAPGASDARSEREAPAGGGSSAEDDSPAAAEDDSPAAAEDDSSGGAAEGGASDAGTAPSLGADTDVVLLADLGEVGTDTFADEVSRARAEEPTGDPEITVLQANSCWAGVASATRWEDHYATTGTAGGSPVVVLMALSPDGSGHAWLMPGDCGRTASVQPLADAALQP